MQFRPLRLLILLAAMVYPVWGQLSPGPLSSAHRNLDSPLSCNECHMFGAGQPVFVCTKCHEVIGEEVASGKGYHGRTVKAAEQERDCAACHREHVSRDFKLVHWPKGEKNFDHAETGYPLTGKHAKVECRTCHTLDRIDLDVLRRAKVQDPNRTYLGLPTECAKCHSDPHRGQVGTECERCHNTVTFEDVTKFDHQQTDFPLTGRHEAVKCAECHKETDGFVHFNDFQSTQCQACHQDPHQGAFPAGCATCHTTLNWLPGELSRNFDHSKTDFPLLGKHDGLACKECHSGAKFREPVAHAQCLDCHREDDPHGGQFTGRADGGECGSCHVVDDFKQSTFDRAMHQKTGYPLTGKHVEVECKECHEPQGPKTVFKIKATACQDCHEDVHKGEFEGEPHRNKCEQCHDVTGFHPSSFTLKRHQESRFRLAGVHVAVACNACHKPVEAAGLSKIPSFHFTDLECPACHEQPHGSQFDGTRVKSSWIECETCHDISTWNALRQFDHARTSFALEGAHRTVACSECHRREDGVPGFDGVVFSDAPVACSGCHEDVHAGQFDKQNDAQVCSACHTNENWEPTQFDHRTYSAFPLDGAHEDVPCKLCHNERRLVDGVEAVVYRGTPRKCEACHRGKL